jgi:hypothetical protein
MTWSDTLLRILKDNDIRLIAYVPDNVLTPLIAGVSADNGRHLYNRADRDHNFDRDRNFEGDRDFQHRGIVRGDFFEHGRHFHFRRFFHGEWVFLTGWDDCTAWAWVHIAPGTWAWRPVDICVG